MTESRWNRDISDRTTDGLALVRDQDWSYTAKLVRPVYNRWAGMNREYVWTDDAACNGVNPELFQMSQVGDPGLEGISTGELRKFNERKFEDARKYCDGCPVRATCLKLSEASDRYWSVRGGLRPTILDNGTLKSLKAPVFPAQDWIEWTCKEHGSDFVMIRSRSGGPRPYCGACSKS